MGDAKRRAMAAGGGAGEEPPPREPGLPDTITRGMERLRAKAEAEPSLSAPANADGQLDAKQPGPQLVEEGGDTGPPLKLEPPATLEEALARIADQDVRLGQSAEALGLAEQMIQRVEGREAAMRRLKRIPGKVRVTVDFDLATLDCEVGWQGFVDGLNAIQHADFCTRLLELGKVRLEDMRRDILANVRLAQLQEQARNQALAAAVSGKAPKH
jgi:hypothetical protein